MTQQATVKLLQSNGQVKDLVLRYSIQSPWFIESPFDPGKKYEGDDLFQCLQSLRSDLEETGARLLCNGSRVNSYPSRMSREMGGARKVCILCKGRQAGSGDLVDTFGDAPADCVGTVAEQEAFYHDWIASLR